MLVDTKLGHVSVPNEQIQPSGEIVLNISPLSIGNLHIDKEATTFQARFSGRVFDIYIPHVALVAIYARENAQGIDFSSNSERQFLEFTTSKSISKKKKPQKHQFRIIKPDN